MNISNANSMMPVSLVLENIICDMPSKYAMDNNDGDISVEYGDSTLEEYSKENLG